MDTYHYLFIALKNHFTWGLIAGFIPCILITYYVGKEKRSLKLQVANLKEYQALQNEIHARGIQGLQDENKALEEQNGNLRSKINQLQAKPDGNIKRELSLYIYAVGKMQAEAPGFATAWANAWKEARQADDDSSKGKGKFFNIPIISMLGFNKMPTAGLISNDQQDK